ncbi:otolith matrix protein OMM-64 isoform X8 [Apis cerana]|uniref:otolith matrix protein OMM-64 isoform X8 n=1 Tax=Apis cerana TaxID=7461 RepID=UPI002B22F54C|nr:otolith matrix protein OMM-64 isoform X8 [Apis cerana]XP_061927580.1 otolith matrix protein OMM-64 isoform X8 [Apis cerana]XP_061927581.1 otolith matrix protein OMM-64 isoform X8 [Apis cerana]XP_061927582.1 otolith matrix protein OMM-64 isoform X8 [Apis cerana]XP_061927583.1 otolith matrix protein OMM-64 isoform X8 [Apis cerana]XP_061927584.1 otolith matrix protein OMM-64 isoform X8 [Apis cerana]XP_061927585.1 otolith matrix protein OMM-64 isoform X8 [Apis cerana]XP_061927586.1 otolith ma
MVVSRREGSISSNIRAIIEQLNLNPVERRRLIDRTKQDGARCVVGYHQGVQPAAKISIGVYGCKEKVGYEIPGGGPIRRAVCRLGPDRSRPRQEAGQRKILAPIKKDGAAREDAAVEEEKAEDNGFGSIRSMSKIEDRPRPKPENGRTATIPQASRERSVRAEDAIEDKGSARCSTRIEDRQRSKPETRQRIPPLIKDAIPRIEEEVIEGSKSPKDTVDRVVPVAKEDLPELESASLSHTAAHHRISVRPKNRRPPRRSGSQVASTPTSTITTIAEDSLDSLQTASANNSNASTPTEPKNVSIGRKSSNRLSRTSDIFEELEAKLPRKPPSVASLSPDSLDAVEMNDEQESRGSIARKSSNRTPKNTEMFEELETKLPRRRSASNRSSKSPDSLEAANGWFSKSTEGFEKLMEYEEVKPVTRRLLGPISKSTDRVSKSSDSLEAIEALTSDESIERRRSSFELRARRSSKKMSKSSESFEMLEQIGTEGVVQELQKRSSISDMNLSRGRRLSKSISKSSEDFERIEISESKEEDARESLGKCSRRSSKRMSSESSDNLDSEDRLENRRMRRAPKRIPSTSYVDIVPMDDQEEEKRAVTGQRKPCRLQKSSESSELGSTDTLDSERRNKSSESTETLDSLERDLDQDRKQEDLTDTVADRREKNDPWTNKSLMMSHSDQMADNNTEDSKPLISPDKFYWRQSSESKENIDIHQLLAITIVTRMADNGNNQRSSVIYPKKKQQITTSQPTSPVAKQEDNKMIFDNLLVSKNDEDLQNMLNGNISEVSTDTKSFKEKLIMFEKLGK